MFALSIQILCNFPPRPPWQPDPREVRSVRTICTIRQEKAPAYRDQTDKEDLENHNTHALPVSELCREEKTECPAPAHLETELACPGTGSPELLGWQSNPNYSPTVDSFADANSTVFVEAPGPWHSLLCAECVGEFHPSRHPNRTLRSSGRLVLKCWCWHEMLPDGNCCHATSQDDESGDLHAEGHQQELICWHRNQDQESRLQHRRKEPPQLCL